jgi:hypothetical protein
MLKREPGGDEAERETLRLAVERLRRSSSAQRSFSV